ncbi:hypothetical protein [Mesorhizobium sp. STM 4661]|uniref:hypothetical protein n=1 Tax=Mesorhizobium sp. STM 4661 TaxID=1297570 RepID=UPI0002BD5B1E|nr:hypothetical protein [Mesorhizobium sp. STM 4661]CCV14212.1 conserved hypothetical protein [Mesorhizobium sp. STM 4661]
MSFAPADVNTVPVGAKLVEGGEKSCPSARAEPGALLIGVVGADGIVQPIPTRLEIDAEFVEQASKAGAPEARFRFAGRCVEGKCKQWTGNSCGVIEKVLTGMTEQMVAPAENLPRCVIRGTCRWYSQRGADACRACVYVVTDQSKVADPA